MKYVIYDNNLDKNELLAKNIVIDSRAKIGKNVKIEPGVTIEGECVILDNCEISGCTNLKNAKIGANVVIISSRIEDSFVGNNCRVGPFAHIRDNTICDENCRIGNFVEIKNSVIGAGSKMAHLTYVGDATIGKNCNLGCGVVFCNYNGQIKQQCQLGDNVFVGSNCNLIAPLKIEDNVFIAAGSTINYDINEGEFAIARARQENKKNFDNPYLKAKK